MPDRQANRTDRDVQRFMSAAWPARCFVAVLAVAALVPARAGATVPDYALLDAVLVENVRDGYVDYDGVAANPKFARFIAGIAAADTLPDGRDERLAYYINAYNAFAIKGILDGYSPASWFGRYRYFRSVKFRLAGADITLEDLEHQRIRPMGDARIHFAIACASMSCPRLASHAYLPATLEEQLDAATRRFVNDITRNYFDIARRTAFVSPIFDRFRSDFEQAAGSLPAYLARYVDEPAARAALLEGRLAVSYLRYDWDLNGRRVRSDGN